MALEVCVGGCIQQMSVRCADVVRVVLPAALPADYDKVPVVRSVQGGDEPSYGLDLGRAGGTLGLGKVVQVTPDAHASLSKSRRAKEGTGKACTSDCVSKCHSSVQSSIEMD